MNYFLPVSLNCLNLDSTFIHTRLLLALLGFVTLPPGSGNLEGKDRLSSIHPGAGWVVVNKYLLK